MEPVKMDLLRTLSIRELGQSVTSLTVARYVTLKLSEDTV
jgi:hypothetical protein